MCSTERGEISAAVGTGERHEVNEKVGMRETMPNTESSDGNSVAAGGYIEENQGRGESLIWARILEC